MNLVIKNARLIDCTGGAPVPSASVQIDKGIITWIGEETARPFKHTHQEEIEARGLTLIPGMIDCHEHFTGDGGLGPMNNLLNDTPETFTMKAIGNCKRALISGVTSARDVGARYAINILIAKETASGAIPGPRIIAAGEWLQMPGTWPPALTQRIETAEDLGAAVRKQIDKGAGLIKIGATGFDANREQFASMSPEALGVAVHTAHAAGLTIAAHCVGFEGTKNSVEAGIDSIEHGTFIDEETVQLMVEKGTYLVPTLSTWDARLRLSKELGVSKKEIGEVEHLKENSQASFRRAHKAGVRIAAGTDAGGSPARHGFFPREIELMVETGMSPVEALESATRVAADLLGIQRHVGTIEVNKQADLVLIDGDPHSDPSALRNVWAVFQNGIRIR